VIGVFYRLANNALSLADRLFGGIKIVHSGRSPKKSLGLQVIELFNVGVIELIDAFDLLR